MFGAESSLLKSQETKAARTRIVLNKNLEILFNKQNIKIAQQIFKLEKKNDPYIH